MFRYMLADIAASVLAFLQTRLPLNLNLTVALAKARRAARVDWERETR